MKNTILFVLLSFGLVRLSAADEAPPTGVVVIDHAKVDAAFVQGQMLMANSSYKVLAGRRVAPGSVEVHALDTDIFYVLEGSAAFVTGGTVSDGTTTAPNEIRGKAIVGGTSHHLVKGDMIVIPKGTPHQFTQVDGTFLYYVVKVTQ